ncbi:hypothetical protein [Alicyclobacillus sendaiensis]|uniref:hypothetical protein n=1 Tax=Alicyclobacillus sendaiensis TaxID=192387 RepID=UPI0026F41AF3|nr:hypothetical protein [Alicyclobacillus sendaiensis]
MKVNVGFGSDFAWHRVSYLPDKKEWVFSLIDGSMDVQININESDLKKLIRDMREARKNGYIRISGVRATDDRKDWLFQVYTNGEWRTVGVQADTYEDAIEKVREEVKGICG